MTTPIAHGDRPSYHLTLSDGVTTVGFIGANGLAGLRRLPRGAGVERKSVNQRDWTAGRGGRLLRDDARRFYDSGRMWTVIPGQAMQAPIARYGAGLRIDNNWQGAPYRWHHLYAGPAGVEFAKNYYAASFAPRANCTVAHLQVWARVVGAHRTAPLKVKLCADNSGEPGTVLATGEIAAIEFNDGVNPDYQTISPPVALNTPQALTGGTTYWIVVLDDATSSAAATSARHYALLAGAYSVADPVRGMWADDGASWVSSGAFNGYALHFRVADNTLNVEHGGHFYEYKRGLYFVQSHDDGSTAPKLFLNGDRGAATSGSTTTLADSTKAWPTDKWAGDYALVVGGTGEGQWAQISGNNGTTLTFVTAMNVAPAAQSLYVIVSRQHWTEITGHGLTKPVTSVAVMNDIVYFAQGDGTAMRRMREFNSAGTWTREYANDGTNHHFIATHLDDANVVRLYGVHRANSVWRKADKQNWGVNLTFGADKPVGDTWTVPTGIEIYDRACWIAKESAVGKIVDDLWKEVPIKMAPGRSPVNGQALVGWNTNIYFSFLGGFERLYGNVVDDIGFNRGIGMAYDRSAGSVSDFEPILGLSFASLDCGRLGATVLHSAILMTTSPGGDWHEVHKGYIPGRRIRRLAFSSLPNGEVTLWAFEAPDLVGLTYNPTSVNLLGTPAPESQLTTSYIDLGTPDLDHYFDELRLFADGLGDGTVIEVDYRLDAATAWTRMGQFSASPFERLDVAPAGTVTGRQIQFRLRFYPQAVLPPIKVWQIELRANQMNEVLYDYLFDIRLEDRLMLLNGDDATQGRATALATLRSWQEDASPLTMRCMEPEFDGKLVHLDPLTLVPVAGDSGEIRLAGSLALKET